ncbi:MAG: sodium:solute symporter family protein [Thermoanaerobaculia bacterium]
MIYVWAIAIYLLFLVGVSVSKSRKVKTQDDFMVAGRGVTAMFLVGTLVCTWIGSGSLFGGAGRAFRQGFSALWMSAGAWLGLAIVYYLAPRVRKIAQYTVPDILETRYNAASRVLGTIAIVIAYLTIAGYQFIGGGRLLEIVTEGAISADTGKIVVCVLVVLYTVLAGMSSIVALDVFNGILITLGVIIAAPLALKGAGGWEGLTNTLPETHFTVFGAPGVAAALGLFLPTFFLLLGESSIYQKFMSATDGKAARRAVIGMIVGVIVIETVLDATAIFGAGQYWTDAAFRTADGALNRATTETILLQLAFEKLPLMAGILLLIGGSAIVFSTANTFLMVPSTNLTRDIYQRFIRPDASDKAIIRFQRVSILVLAGVTLLVTTQFENILDMALYAYTMVGAAVTPALLAAFLWRRVTAMGGMISIASGMLGTIVFAGLARFGLESLPLGFMDLPLDYDYIIYPAGFLSFASLIIVSLLTPPSPKEKWQPFWE